MAEPRVAPYGSWKSPITTDLIVAETIGLGRIVLDGADTYWAEARPSEAGRNIIVKRTPSGETFDVTPSQYSVTTRVHEYGARGYTVADGVVYFSNFDDQRLYRHRPGERPVPITPEGTEGELRYGGMVLDRSRGRIICVREDHTTSDEEPVHTVVAIDANGRDEATVLVSGNDFYAAPRISPDGTTLAWLAWNHPNMPWDDTSLYSATVTNQSLSAITEIMTQNDESIYQPSWSPDGQLHFVSDRSNWWNIYSHRGGILNALTPMSAEFGWGKDFPAPAKLGTHRFEK